MNAVHGLTSQLLENPQMAPPDIFTSSVILDAWADTHNLGTVSLDKIKKLLAEDPVLPDNLPPAAHTAILARFGATYGTAILAGTQDDLELIARSFEHRHRSVRIAAAMNPKITLDLVIENAYLVRDNAPLGTFMRKDLVEWFESDTGWEIYSSAVSQFSADSQRTVAEFVAQFPNLSDRWIASGRMHTTTYMPSTVPVVDSLIRLRSFQTAGRVLSHIENSNDVSRYVVSTVDALLYAGYVDHANKFVTGFYGFLTSYGRRNKRDLEKDLLLQMHALSRRYPELVLPADLRYAILVVLPSDSLVGFVDHTNPHEFAKLASREDALEVLTEVFVSFKGRIIDMEESVRIALDSFVRNAPEQGNPGFVKVSQMMLAFCESFLASLEVPRKKTLLFERHQRTLTTIVLENFTDDNDFLIPELKELAPIMARVPFLQQFTVNQLSADEAYGAGLELTRHSRILLSVFPWSASAVLDQIETRGVTPELHEIFWHVTFKALLDNNQVLVDAMLDVEYLGVLLSGVASSDAPAVHIQERLQREDGFPKPQRSFQYMFSTSQMLKIVRSAYKEHSSQKIWAHDSTRPSKFEFVRNIAFDLADPDAGHDVDTLSIYREFHIPMPSLVEASATSQKPLEQLLRSRDKLSKIIIDELGNDVKAWDTVYAVAPSWQGSLCDLLSFATD